MVIYVHLHTLKVSSRWISWKGWCAMKISICFISKLFGALIVKKNINATSASTHTTGKTSEENLIFTSTVKTSADTGRQRKTPRPTRMAANLSTVAAVATVGKNRSTIPQTSACKNVVDLKMISAAKRTVPISTQRKKGVFLTKQTLNLFLAIGAQP